MEGPSIMSKVDEIKSDISRLGDEEFKVLKNHIKQEEKSRRTKKAKETLVLYDCKKSKIYKNFWSNF